MLQRGAGTSDGELRPVVPDELQASLRKSPNLVIEVEPMA
jgi:hypothetical protein